MLKDEERIAEVKQRIAKKRTTAETAAQTDYLCCLYSGMLCSDRWDFLCHARYYRAGRTRYFFRL